MRRTVLLCLSTSLIGLSLALPASAQINPNREVYDRMDKLERDLMTLQRQAARGGSGPVVGGGDMPGEGNASLEVRLSSMEEEMRGLRGKIEENEFQVRRLNETFTRFQQDVEFRLNEQAGSAMPPAAAPEAPARPAKGRPAPAPVPEEEVLDSTDETVDTGSEALAGTDDSAEADAAPPEKTTAGDGTLRMPAGNAKAVDGKKEFENPRDHYNYAFRLLNQTRYDDAATYFQDFTQKYRKDPLIGNAYYWLGETFYIRRDYVKAADNFRQGFEILPSGPKAADNLLKLSMSLSALKKNKEACVVLDQILLKFKETSTSVAQKAQGERTRIGCK